jgi:hypothetical protein
MITGAHSVIFSKNPNADRAFFRDVLELPSIDVGDGWLLFGLPSAEVAVHPSDEKEFHILYLLCDDVEAVIEKMAKHGIKSSPVKDEGWGLLTELKLPGGGNLGIYQPQHARLEPLRP